MVWSIFSQAEGCAFEPGVIPRNVYAKLNLKFMMEFLVKENSRMKPAYVMSVKLPKRGPALELQPKPSHCERPIHIRPNEINKFWNFKSY